MGREFNLKLAEEHGRSNYSDYRGVISVDRQEETYIFLNKILADAGYSHDEWFIIGFELGGADKVHIHPTSIMLYAYLISVEKYGRSFEDVQDSTRGEEVHAKRVPLNLELSDIPKLIKRYQICLLDPVTRFMGQITVSDSDEEFDDEED